MRNVSSAKSGVLFKRVTLFLLLSFVVVLVLGLSMGMQHSMGEMPKINCIFDSYNGCDMTLNEHLSFWQQFFTANVFNLKIEFILFAGLLFTFVFAVFSRKVLEFFRLWKLRPMLFYERRNSVLSFSNLILRLLSAGILQPKVYRSLDI